MTNRRGSVLAFALIALTVVAALGAGATFATREARRAAHDALAELRARAAAERALELSIVRWDRRRNTLAIGASDSIDVPGDPPATTRAIRLDDTRVLVESAARARTSAPGAAGVADRTVARIVQLQRPLPNALAAVTFGGTLQLSPGAVIDGRDTPPAGWTNCTEPRVDVPDSVTNVVPTTYDRFGAETWAQLAARADTAASIVYAPGDLTLRGPATFQGTLLVAGDLVVVGTVTIVGTVVVRGAVRADALQLTGALLVAHGASTLGAGSRVTYSRCATKRVADVAALISVDRRRSWADVTR